MSDLQPIFDVKTILTAIVGAFTGVLAWLGKRLHSKVDRMVDREEFTETLREWRDERNRMHSENRETLDRIHERVDDLWKTRYGGDR